MSIRLKWSTRQTWFSWSKMFNIVKINNMNNKVPIARVKRAKMVNKANNRINLFTMVQYGVQKSKQAGAELCQAQHSLSLDLDTNFLGLITQPAVGGARSLAELQLRIYWHAWMVVG